MYFYSTGMKYFNVFYSLIKSTNYLFLTRNMLETDHHRIAVDKILLNVDSIEKKTSFSSCF